MSVYILLQRSLVAFRSPAAGRMPKPGRSCAPKPCRRSPSEARQGAGNCPARPGPARRGPAARRSAVRSSRAQRGQAGPGQGRRRKRHGKDGLDEVEITCACRRMTDRARRLPTFVNKSRKTTKSHPSTGDQLGKRKCLSTFFSTEFRADRRVYGGSNKEPLAR